MHGGTCWEVSDSCWPNGNYRGRSSAFWVNRILRLYPAYLVVLSVTAATIAIVPELMSEYGGRWGAKWTAYRWLENLLIFPLTFHSPLRFVPPAWSVAVELINYALLWLFIARGRWQAITALVLGLGYHVYCIANGLGWQPRYFPWYSAVLPFSLGALAFFAGRDGYLLKPLPLAAAVVAWAVNVTTPSVIDVGGWVWSVGWYVNIGLAVLIVGSLAYAKASKVDKWLGDLAYPVFLVHWFAGFCVWLLLPDLGTRGLALFIVSAPVVLAMSYAIVRFVDARVIPLRDAIRGSANRLRSSRSRMGLAT